MRRGLIKPRRPQSRQPQSLIHTASRSPSHSRPGSGYHVPPCRGPLPISPDTFERDAAGVHTTKTLYQVLYVGRGCGPSPRRKLVPVPAHPAKSKTTCTAPQDPVPRRPCRKGARVSTPPGCDKFSVPAQKFLSIPGESAVTSLTSMNVEAIVSSFLLLCNYTAIEMPPTKVVTSIYILLYWSDTKTARGRNVQKC